MYFNEKDAVEVFRKTWLEGNYDFLTEDLVKLGNAFAKAAEVQIAKKERDECVKFTHSLNSYVARALEEKRRYAFLDGGSVSPTESEVDAARKSGLL